MFFNMSCSSHSSRNSRDQGGRGIVPEVVDRVIVGVEVEERRGK